MPGACSGVFVALAQLNASTSFGLATKGPRTTNTCMHHGNSRLCIRAGARLQAALLLPWYLPCLRSPCSLPQQPHCDGQAVASLYDSPRQQRLLSCYGLPPRCVLCASTAVLASVPLAGAQQAAGGSALSTSNGVLPAPGRRSAGEALTGQHGCVDWSVHCRLRLPLGK